MKSIATLFTAVIFSFAGMAQIPNPGFEQLNTDGSLRNWGNVYLWAVHIDSSGNSYVDSIAFDGQLYFATPDAHTGSVALEMRNAWNFTLNQGIAGGVTADTDSVYSAWGSFETFPLQPFNQPINFAFFYEYFPVNNDTASATLVVYDSSMNHLGEAVILISGTTSNYTLATAPVIYTSPGDAAFAFIHFRTAIYGSVPSFGTRFLVDNVMFNYVTGTEELSKKEFTIYPNPSRGKINLDIENFSNNFTVEVINLFGQVLSTIENEKQIDISDLSPGIYVVRIKHEDEILVTRIVKE